MILAINVIEIPSEKNSKEFLQIDFFKNAMKPSAERKFSEVSFDSLTAEQQQKILDFESFIKTLIV